MFHFEMPTFPPLRLSNDQRLRLASECSLFKPKLALTDVANTDDKDEQRLFQMALERRGTARMRQMRPELAVRFQMRKEAAKKEALTFWAAKKLQMKAKAAEADAKARETLLKVNMQRQHQREIHSYTDPMSFKARDPVHKPKLTHNFPWTDSILEESPATYDEMRRMDGNVSVNSNELQSVLDKLSQCQEYIRSLRTSVKQCMSNAPMEVDSPSSFVGDPNASMLNPNVKKPKLEKECQFMITKGTRLLHLSTLRLAIEKAQDCTCVQMGKLSCPPTLF